MKQQAQTNNSKPKRIEDEMEKTMLDYTSRLFPSPIYNSMIRAASTLRLPFWMYIMGLVKQAWDSGTLYVVSIDPVWRTRHGILQRQAVCEKCGQTFQPVKRGVYICPGCLES